MGHSDTIYALASGHGKAGVAVFRISGRDAFAVLPQLGVAAKPEPRQATLVALKTPLSSLPPLAGGAGGGSAGQLLGTENASRAPSPNPSRKQEGDMGGKPIDTALSLTFPGPNSFTGEDVLELHTHGSRAVTALLLTTLKSLPNLRLAEPGEFARRAFLNDKFDLLEAEGLADLIDAETPAQHAQAMRQLGGELSEKIMGLRQKILEPLALLEAYIDFPDEEIPEETLAQVTAQVTALTEEIRALLDDGGIGEKIRDGIEIVIFGPPNAGKSSLLNAIAKRDIAIVSAEAGTTRDMIEVHLDLDGYPVTLVDTAGLRDAEGSIEAEGIRRAHHRIERAALKIALLDATTAAADYKKLQPMIDDKTLVILNKSDLLAPSPPAGEGWGKGAACVAPSSPNFPPPPPNLLPRGEEECHDSRFTIHDSLFLSATTGENFDQFIALLKDRVGNLLADAPSPLITRHRHRQAFQHSLTALTKFRPKAALELNCEELRVAALEIGKITGKITTDDLLDLVFSRFCIGK